MESSSNHLQLFQSLKKQFMKNDSQSEEDPSASSPVQFDADVQHILQKLSKKSDTTKLKAMEQLKAVVAEKPQAFFEVFIPTWAIIYEKMVTTEYDKRVLEEVNRFMDFLGKNAKKPLSRIFKSIFPSWFLSCHDLYSDVAAISKNALSSMLPDQAKLSQAIIVCQEELVKFLQSTLDQGPKQIQEINVHVETKQAELTYERVLSGCFRTLGAAIAATKGHPQAQKLHEKLATFFGLSSQSTQKKSIFHSFLEKNTTTPITKGSLIHLMLACVESFAPELISKGYLDLTRLALFNLLPTKERLVQKDLWTCSLLPALFDRLPEEEIPKLEKKKAEQALLECVKGCAYGAERPYISNLIFTLAKFPFLKIGNAEKLNLETLQHQLGFLKTLLKEFINARNKEEIKFTLPQYYQSYYEIVLFFSTKRFSPLLSAISSKDQESEPKKKEQQLLEESFSEFLLLPVQVYCTQSSKTSRESPFDSTKPIPESFSQFFVHALRDPSSSIFPSLFEELKKSLSDTKLASRTEHENFFEVISQLNIGLSKEISKNVDMSHQVMEFVVDINQHFLKSFSLESISKLFQSPSTFTDMNIEKNIHQMEILHIVFENIFVKENEVTKLVLSIQNIDYYVDAFTSYISFSKENCSKIVKVARYETLAAFLAKTLVYLTHLQQIQQNHIEKISKALFNKDLAPGSLMRKDCPSFEWLLFLYFLNGNISWPYFSDSIASLSKGPSDSRLVLQKDSPTFSSPPNYLKVLFWAPETSKPEALLLFQVLLKEYLSAQKSTVVMMQPFLQAGISLFCQNSEAFEELSSNVILPKIQQFCGWDWEKNAQKRGSAGLGSTGAALEMWKMSLIAVFKQTEVENPCIQKHIEILFDLVSGELSHQRFSLKIYAMVERLRLQNQKLYQNILETFGKRLKEVFEASVGKFQTTPEQKRLYLICLSDYLRLVSGRVSDRATLRSFSSDFLLSYPLYKGCLGDDLCWRAFRKVLKASGSVISFGEMLFKECLQSEKEERIQIFIYFLTVSSSLAVFDSLHLKRFYNSYTKEIVEPLLMKEILAGSESFYNCAKCILKTSAEDNLVMLLPLRKVISEITADESISPALLTKIYENIFEPQMKMALDSEAAGKTILKLRHVFALKILISSTKSQLFVQDCFKSFIEAISERFAKRLPIGPEKAIDLEFLVELDLFVTLLSQKKANLEAASLLSQNETQQLMVREIAGLYMKTDKSEGFLQNYIGSVFFEILNWIIEKESAEVMISVIPEIEEIALSCFSRSLNAANQHSTTVLIKAMQFLRKVIPFIEIFTEKFIDSVFSALLDICLAKVEEAKSRELAMKNSLEEFNDSLMVEIAETLSRISINIKSSLNVNQVFKLMNCHIPIIQKSAFFLMRHYIQNYPVQKETTELEKIFEFLKSEEINEQDGKKKEMPDLRESDNDLLQVVVGGFSKQGKKETGPGDIESEEEEEEEEKEEENTGIKHVNSKKVGYLLSWACVMYQLKTTAFSDFNSIYKAIIRKLVGFSPEHYEGFLNTLIRWVKELNIGDKPHKKMIDPTQILEYDPQWYGFLQDFSFFVSRFQFFQVRDFLQLSVHVFFLFSRTFPKFLRNWNDKADKNLKSISNFYLKTIVSSSIFNYEIENIELRSSEWKAEDFDIHVYKNTQEIIAEYKKESSTIEVQFKIPETYPLTIIDIKLVKKLKLPEAKLTKWMLMMKSVLTNENSTILDSLMIWKRNVDKEFEGVEECPICYYVLHATNNELPKMACRTCKHKFHSLCIHKWFTSSNKSECPLCKSQFL